MTMTMTTPPGSEEATNLIPVLPLKNANEHGNSDWLVGSCRGINVNGAIFFLSFFPSSFGWLRWEQEEVLRRPHKRVARSLYWLW